MYILHQIFKLILSLVQFQEHFTRNLPTHYVLTTYNNVQGLLLNHDGRIEMLDEISPNCFLLATLVSLNINPN